MDKAKEAQSFVEIALQAVHDTHEHLQRLVTSFDEAEVAFDHCNGHDDECDVDWNGVIARRTNKTTCEKPSSSMNETRKAAKLRPWKIREGAERNGVEELGGVRGGVQGVRRV